MTTGGNGPLVVEVQGISKRFGGLQALDDVSLVARGGEVTAVIGPNGAGKSTLLDCLTGITAFDTGRIIIDDTAHTSVRLDRLVDVGISRTFQHIRLFEGLTALEHIVLVRRNLLSTDRGRACAPRLPEPGHHLERVGIADKAGKRPAELSYGERRRLEIARALATSPRFLLLDEPAAGSTLSEQNELAGLIRSIADDGVAVVLVEHHMDLVARVSSRVVVINFGRHVVTGTIDEVRRHPEVISAYLGVAA